MVKKSNKISTRWISETRNEFRAFLDETDFPAPDRIGERGPAFTYPEWLIMFIAILSVKMKIKTYVQIHKMAVKYWDVIAQGLDLTPISERQLRERLKKILHFPAKPAAFIFELFPELDQGHGDQRR
jgi:hypothetical protein